jgi:hypothetical protein
MLDLLAGVVIGAHIASVHIPNDDYLNNVNPGVYVRLANGATLGTYRNSLARQSVYAGWTFERTVLGVPAAITVGAITGYQLKDGPCVGKEAAIYTHCTYGNTKHPVGLLLAPSVRLPTILGVMPRITVLPKIAAKGHTVVHLSIEHSF